VTQVEARVAQVTQVEARVTQVEARVAQVTQVEKAET
jgi:hypothetical protein